MDLTPAYKSLGFVDASEAVLWPYVETLDGGEVWIQPLILEGENLERYIRAGFDFLFKRDHNIHAFRFDSPFPVSPAERAMAGRAEPGIPLTPKRQSEERNGVHSH